MRVLSLGILIIAVFLVGVPAMQHARAQNIGSTTAPDTVQENSGFVQMLEAKREEVAQRKQEIEHNESLGQNTVESGSADTDSDPTFPLDGTSFAQDVWNTITNLFSQ